MKLCKDCKWFRPSTLGEKYHKCDSPRARRNPVTGDIRISFCDIQRSTAWWLFLDCGKNGRFFEPRDA